MGDGEGPPSLEGKAGWDCRGAAASPPPRDLIWHPLQPGTKDVLFGEAFRKDQTAVRSSLRDGVSGPRTPKSPGRIKPPPLLALSAGRLSTEQAGIPLLPRELVPPGQGWDTVARGGWGRLALPLPVLYLFCG